MIWIIGFVLTIIFFAWFLILSFRKKITKRDGKIEKDTKDDFDWNRALFIHASEEGMGKLRIFLWNYPVDWLVPKLKNGLFVWQREGGKEVLDNLKRALEEMGFYVEEVPYKKVMEQEMITLEERMALLGT